MANSEHDRFCDQCAGPFPPDQWPGSQYGGHWDTCPNRVGSGAESSNTAAVDPVNHPSHYTSGPACEECGHVIEAITITRQHGFARGNAIKYLWRAGLKHPDRLIEDLEKAVFYIKDEINQHRRNQ